MEEQVCIVVSSIDSIQKVNKTDFDGDLDKLNELLKGSDIEILFGESTEYWEGQNVIYMSQGRYRVPKGSNVMVIEELGI